MEEMWKVMVWATISSILLGDGSYSNKFMVIYVSLTWCENFNFAYVYSCEAKHWQENNANSINKQLKETKSFGVT